MLGVRRKIEVQGGYDATWWVTARGGPFHHLASNASALSVTGAMRLDLCQDAVHRHIEHLR
jgi:hypothetical protein